MRVLLLSLVVLFATPAVSGATDREGEFLSRKEALELAFPECALERRVFYPTDEDRKRASKLAGFEIDAKIFFVYVATREGQLVGTAWFDVHEVRTKKETLMLVVDPKRRVRRIELLAFAEPHDYIPRGSWYAQFVGKQLDDELALERGIKTVSGATLTARATTEAARRMLALHAIAFPSDPDSPPRAR